MHELLNTINRINTSQGDRLQHDVYNHNTKHELITQHRDLKTLLVYISLQILWLNEYDEHEKLTWGIKQ